MSHLSFTWSRLIARARRGATALLASLIVLATLSGSVPSVAVASTSNPGLAALSVSGNRLLRAGQPFQFHGLNRDTLEWGRFNWGGCGGDGHFTSADFANISTWKVNIVRIPLSQANWLGRRCNAAHYRLQIDNAVAKAHALGMYVILDLHWSDVGGQAPCDSSCTTGQQPMPDADSVTFWQQVAAHYSTDAGIIFDLYNEPHDVPWSCWRDGGCTVQSSTPNPSTGKPVAYTAVGLQQLHDVVTAAAPSNVVLVAGLDWAYDLSGIGNGYGLAGTNIVYDTHVYTQWHSTVSDWSVHFGYLTATHPVVATEFGSIDCSSAVTKQLLDYFDAPDGIVGNDMGWTIWSWNSPGECSQPTVLADWNGTPLAGQGQLIHDWLLTYPL